MPVSGVCKLCSCGFIGVFDACVATITIFYMKRVHVWIIHNGKMIVLTILFMNYKILDALNTKLYDCCSSTFEVWIFDRSANLWVLMYLPIGQGPFHLWTAACTYNLVSYEFKL